jgi:septal ring factor EnvC (AmiA/AmiB activator)
VKKILLTTTALHQPWNEGDWDMTDGNTYAINKHLDEREDYDALQEVTAELEQAEARIEELSNCVAVLEAKLAKAFEALCLADAALSGANMNMRVVEKSIKSTLAELKGQEDE